MTRILVVDDSKVTRSLVKLTLETLEYVSVDTAKNAHQALNFCEQNHYDLMIVDYMMPEQTGIEFIDTVHQRHLQDDAPIFILSAESDAMIKQEAQRHHVDAWLTKPFRPQTLLELIQQRLQDAQ